MEFYDYKTGPVTDNILFDTRKTGMSYYDELIRDPKYMSEKNNLASKIVMMTPKQYFEECAKIFNSTFDRQINQTKADKATLDKLKRVITELKVKFPLGFLNYAENAQEGRHRMYTAGELVGWDTKQPVMVITWADEERHKREVDNKHKNRISQDIDRAITQTLLYSFGNIEELEIQLQYELNKSFYADIGEDIEFTFESNDEDEAFEVTVDGVTRTFDYEDIRWSTEPEDEDDFDWDSIDLDNIDLDDLDIDSLLKESIEKHDKLNPILFLDDKLRPEVRSRIMKIVEQYIADSQFLEMNNIIDVELVGSNASFNYTKDSDIDVHIVVNMESISSDPALVQVACNAEKGVFNSKYDFKLFGVDVELYVEDVKAGTASNGIYSILNNGWIKYPTQTVVPDVSDNKEYHELLNSWSERAEKVLKSESANDIQIFIDDIYNLRRQSIMVDGEYALGNLVFKEIRNVGLLDALKDRKSEVISKEYSL